MALVLADRVNETTTTSGTGTLTLAGAVTGFQSFATVGNANTTYYTIVHQTANEWEVGLGTYTSAGTTLSRDTVLASSAGGTTKVTFSAGTKYVFCDYPAGKAIFQDASGNVVFTPSSTGIGTGLYVNGGDITAARTASTGAIYFGSNNASRYLYHDGTNYIFGSVGAVTTNTDFRAPLFYDLDNTAYYANPAGTSNFSTLTLGSGNVLGAFATFNNMNQTHGTQTDFNSIANFGAQYVQGSTNGPGIPSATQYYGFSLGLGSEYAYSSYASQIYWPRTPVGGSPYVSVRFREGGTWGSWAKIYAGYADSAGTASAVDFNNLTNKTGGTGTYTTSGDYRAPIFYDSNNTAYYLDPASSSNINAMTMAGTLNMWAGLYDGLITFGSSSGWRCGIRQYDSANAELRVYAANALGKIFFATGYDGASTTTLPTDGMMLYSNNVGIGNFSSGVPSYKLHVKGTAYSDTDFRAPIFYDSDNTGYYVDPNSNTNLNRLLLNNGVGAFADGVGNDPYGFISVTRGTGANYAYFGMTRSGQIGMGFGIDTSNQIWFGSTSAGYNATRTSTYIYFNSSGDFWAVNSSRAPIFYDSDNTAYYLNPASTSILNTVQPNVINFSNSNNAILLNNSSYQILCDPTGRVALYLGGADPANYYDNTAHYFRNRSAVGIATIDSSGMKAPVFYDYDNTAYYLDPNGTSNVSMSCIGLWYFRSNPGSGVYVGSTTSPPLQAFSNDGGAAYMSFHRSGAYAVNFGLDPDNVLRIGGWSAASNRLQLDMSGNLTLAGYGSFSGSLYTGDGLYYGPNTSIFFFYNSVSTYGQWRIGGSKGSYGGIYDQYSGVNGIMYDSAGNGGVYREASGRWYFYHNVSNNCLGIGSSSTSSSYYLYVSGAIYATGNIVAYSDSRKKKDIVTIDAALDKVCRMRGVYYTRIETDDPKIDPNKRQLGVIAQELDAVLPEAVTYAADVDEYGVQYGNLAGVFIEAIKELRQEIQDLKSRLS